MHNEKHPLAGTTVKVVTDDGEVDYHLEDWWDHLTGKSWQNSQVIAAFNYASRVVSSGLPWDDEVVYGKIGPFGYLVHVNELHI